MSKEWRWMLGFAAAVLLAAASLAGQTAGEMTGPSHNLVNMKVSSSSAGPLEVSLLTDGEVSFETLLVSDPDRFVLDLHGTVDRLDASRIDVGSAGVTAVRAAQHRNDPTPVTRVVFDLDGPSFPEVERRGSAIVVRFDAVTEAIAQTVAEPVEVPAAVPEPVEAAGSVADLIAELEGRHPEATETPAPQAPETAALEDAATEIAAMAADEVAAPAMPEVDDVLPVPSRAVERDLIDELLETPGYSAPETELPQEGFKRRQSMPASFETKTIGAGGVKYSGKRSVAQPRRRRHQAGLPAVPRDLGSQLRARPERQRPGDDRARPGAVGPGARHHPEEQQPGQSSREQRHPHRDDAETGPGGRGAEAVEGRGGARGRADHDHPHAFLRQGGRTSSGSSARAAS